MIAKASKAKRVALYLRVSTSEQTTRNQRRELREVAERHGWEVVAVFEDEGISGAKGRDERPGFDALMKAVARREIDMVAAWSVDRLGRSLMDLLAFLRDLHAKGVDLFLHQQGLDTSTPSGRAMFQMLGVFAEFERAMIHISFADWELMRQREQGVRLEPLLEAISNFLDGCEELIERARRDLVRGLKKPGTGRIGLSPRQILRSLILMRLKNWNYRELRERIADGLTLRRFTDFYCATVPKHDAFQRGFGRLTPQTLEAINDLVVQAAVELGLEDGAKLRVDTTVVQTDIHHPADNTLLWMWCASSRAWSAAWPKRWSLGESRAFAITGVRRGVGCTRSQRMTTRRSHEQQARTYRVLIGIAEEVVRNARASLEKTHKRRGRDMFADGAIEELRTQIEHFCQLGSRVIDQTRRRVIDGEQVPNNEKIYSLFEPHTDLIKRGKVHTPIEFGHKVFLAESAQGLVTQYEVLRGNPPDDVHVTPSLRRHRQAFGRAPELYGTDRGFFSEQNLASCRQVGVKVVCIPQRGGRKTKKREAYERSAAFKQGQRFRAGIEGRISVLFRGRGMKRCLAAGPDRFEFWVGAAVLANNLMRIAAMRTQQSSRRRRAA